ncbi:hypothetical protein M405DRAFT_816399 [Rhizopogon salebrosus TDB-379]|nr:hypothetical protein M405DRAFT_816399 [Rhizopogon salebrosus TDB-379]
MSLTKAWPLIVVLAVAFAPRGAFAQETTVTCLSSFDWMNNSLIQNPCSVASYLVAACEDMAVLVGPLPAGSQYGLKSDDPSSECNTVIYSMFSACATCQNGTFQNWSAWSVNCTQVHYSTFPLNIPSGTVVPHWAYLDVVTSDKFNATAAQLAGDTPESTATQAQSTSSIVSSTASVSASLTTIVTGSSTAQTPSSTSTSKGSHVGDIAGGSVGGVIGIAIAGIAAWLFVRRRRSRRRTPSETFKDISGGPGFTQSAYMTQQPRLYNPSDPSTFPPASGEILINTSIPSHVYSQESRPGQYNGVPEV